MVRAGLAGALSLVASGRGRAEGEAEPGAARVAFIGDSMADGLWGAFVRTVAHDPCLKDRLQGGRYARNGTGLTRTDSYDWCVQARKTVDSYRPTAVVASIGINDRQDVVEPGFRASFGTPAWDTAYRGRIGLLLQAAAASGAAVMLIGLPAMRDTLQNADAQAKNRLFAEAVATAGRANIRYVEPWRAANAAPSVFTSASPGATGGFVQVRAPDGIHFTMVGYDIVMDYLLPTVLAGLKEAGRDVKVACPAG